MNERLPVILLWNFFYDFVSTLGINFLILFIKLIYDILYYRPSNPLMNYDRLVSTDSTSISFTDSSSLDKSFDGLSQTSVFPYYKPVLASEARARTVPNGYHVSLVLKQKLMTFSFNTIFRNSFYQLFIATKLLL